MCRHSPHPVWYYEFSYIGAHSHYQDPVTKKPVGKLFFKNKICLSNALKIGVNPFLLLAST